MPKDIKKLKKGDIIFVETTHKDTGKHMSYDKFKVKQNYENHIILENEDKSVEARHNRLNDWFEDKPIDEEDDSYGPTEEELQEASDAIDEMQRELTKEAEPTWLQKKIQELKEELKSYF